MTRSEHSTTNDTVKICNVTTLKSPSYVNSVNKSSLEATDGYEDKTTHRGKLPNDVAGERYKLAMYAGDSSFGTKGHGMFSYYMYYR